MLKILYTIVNGKEFQIYNLKNKENIIMQMS